MPSASDKVVLEIGLDAKKVPKGIKDLQKKFEDLAKKLEKINESIVKGFKSQESALVKVASAAKNSAAAVAAAEKQKVDAIQKANKVIDEQEKKLTKLQKTMAKLKSAGRGAAGLAAGGAAGFAGYMMGGIQQSVAAYSQYGMSIRGLTGTGISRKQLGRATGKGIGLGYGMSETAQQAIGIGRATGRAADVTTAQQFGYAAGGMGVGEAGGIMGALYKGGVGFGGKDQQGRKELSKIITSGMEAGLDRGKIPEFAGSVSKIVDQMSARGVGKADVGGAAGGLGWLMKGLGMKSPERAMQVAQGLDTGIRTPGGGEAGQAMMLQAFGFGKPGGTTDIYEATKRQQQGFFGGEKGQGIKNVQDVLSEFVDQYGEKGVGGKTESMKMANFMASKVLPLTLEQVEQLQEINNTTESQEEKNKKIAEILKKAEPLDKQMLTQTKKGFTGVASRVAGLEAKMIAMGAKYWGPMTKIQETSLDLMSKFAGPLADGISRLILAVESLVTNLQQIWAWAKERWGGVTSPLQSVSSVGEKASEAVSSRIDMWKKTVSSRTRGVTPRTLGQAVYGVAGPEVGSWTGRASLESGKEKERMLGIAAGRRKQISNLFKGIQKEFPGQSRSALERMPLTEKAAGLARNMASSSFRVGSGGIKRFAQEIESPTSKAVGRLSPRDRAAFDEAKRGFKSRKGGDIINSQFVKYAKNLTASVIKNTDSNNKVTDSLTNFRKLVDAGKWNVPKRKNKADKTKPQVKP